MPRSDFKKYFFLMLVLAFTTDRILAADLPRYEPRSSVGNVDCGRDYMSDLKKPCLYKKCLSDDDCVSPETGSGAPGGLRSVCLADAQVCGWLYPGANRNSH